MYQQTRKKVAVFKPLISQVHLGVKNYYGFFLKITRQREGVFVLHDLRSFLTL